MALITSNRIRDFIESLNLPEDIAGVLLQDDEDCHLFFDSFYMRNKYLIDDLLDFREYKIEKSQKTLESFVEECYNTNMKIAFESTFYQCFTIHDIGLIAEAIINGKTSFEKLFKDFKNNPNENVLKNIL